MWEPHPWDLDAPAADIQRQGFQVRAMAPVHWQRIPYDALPAAGLFGMGRDQLISADAVCHATAELAAKRARPPIAGARRTPFATVTPYRSGIRRLPRLITSSC